MKNLGLRKYRLRLYGFYFRSTDEKGKMSWGMEVEPPEDMDNTDYIIDPHMRIWKSMKGSGQDKKALKAEEDLDHLHHPSVTDLTIQIQRQGRFPDADVPAEPLQYVNMQRYLKAEEDRDDIDHPAFTEMDSEEPGQDRGEVSNKETEELGGNLASVVADRKIRVHLLAEEDMDDLYHKSPPQLIPYQKGDASLEVPSQRKHSEPEIDLDHLYHK